MIQTAITVVLNYLILPLLRLYWYTCRPKTRGATCIILHRDHILLVQHTYGSRNWGLPGGGLKRNETPEEAIKREIYEEVGIRLPQVHLHGHVFYTGSHRRDTIWVFSATVPTREFALEGYEIAQAQWFAITDLPRNLNASTMYCLEMAGMP